MYSHRFPMFSFIFALMAFSFHAENFKSVTTPGLGIKHNSTFLYNQGLANYNSWTKFSPLLAFVIKYYWNKVRLTHLCIVYCCSGATIGDLSSCNILANKT